MTEIEQEISEAMAADPNYPLGETDAMKWAVAWRLTRDRNGIDANASQAAGDIDGWMVGWFANAMASADPEHLLRSSIASPARQPMDMARKNGGWVLGYVPFRAEKGFMPWLAVTWGDNGWVDDNGDQCDPTCWVPLPDPQPENTGWTPPAGTIRVQEITGEGWTMNGKPVEVPYRWAVFIEKPDGTYDEYREIDHTVTIEQAQERALKWRQKFGLPIETTFLDKKVVPFKPPVTLQ